MREWDISLASWQRGCSWWCVQNYQECISVSLSPFSLTSISGNIYQQHLLGIYPLRLWIFTGPEPLMCSDSNCALKEEDISQVCHCLAIILPQSQRKPTWNYNSNLTRGQMQNALSFSPYWHIIPCLMSEVKAAEEALESYKKGRIVWVTYCFSKFVSDHNSRGEKAEFPIVPY